MPKPSPADVRYFAEQHSCAAVATALLGREFHDRAAAAGALAELAADRAALGELLAVLPGGALAALRVLSESMRPLAEMEIASPLEVEVGRGRGKAAFQALLGRGFLGLIEQGFPRYEIWKPLRAPIRDALAGLDVAPAPEAAPDAVPDRAGLAIALLLGQLWRSPPKITRGGGLYKKDAAELDRIFGGALGAGVAERFVHAFHRLGLLAMEVTEGERMGCRFTPGDDPGVLLSKPRAERVRTFAGADVVPRWMGAAFAAGRGLISREGLRCAAARHDGPPVLPLVDEWIGYSVAAGILDELPGGLRASAEVCGQPAPERPSAGRWLVQPNLEVVVPPDVPLADAFRLACVAEIGSLDRAAVLRITPGSLLQAAEAGLGVEEIVGRLAVRAGAPLPDLVLRSVRDGARGRPAAWIHEGVVVVVPDEARGAVRERIGEYASEIAPRVFLVEEGAEGRVRKALSALDLSLHQPSTRHQSSGSGLRKYAASELEALVQTPCVPPADARLVRAVAGARSGDPAAFERTAQPVVNPPPAAVREIQGEQDLDALLDELLHRLERGEELHPELVPRAERQLFLGRLNRVLNGRASPEAFGPGFALALARLLADRPTPTGGGRGAASDRLEPSGGGAAAGWRGEGGEVPALDAAWEPAAARAIAERLDLWVGLSGERRPRLVTPHRVVHRDDGSDLLALTHDSGDLRVFPGGRITGVAPGGASADVHLPGASPDRPALRAARNERCPCGSGRKYKACCLPADLAAAAG